MVTWRTFYIILVIWVMFLFLFMLGLDVASAQTPTETPTEILPTQTMPPSSGIDCPDEVIGWGTYTPSPLWYVECSHCVNTPTPTATVVPTFDSTAYPTEYAYTATAQYLTGTPTPTITPTPTTPSNYPAVTCEGGTGSIVCEQINDHLVKYSGSHELNYPTQGSFNLYYSMTETSDMYLSIVGTDKIQYAHIGNNSLFGMRLESRSNAWDTVGYPTVYMSWQNYNTGVEDNSLAREDFQFTNTNTGVISIMAVGLGEWANTYNGVSFMSDSDGVVYLSSAPIPADPSVTPTPTPTAPDTLCSSVVPLDEDMFGFDLFIPDGAPNCDMGWDEFQVADYVIPAVEICFQPSQFGVITLFGNEYEVGVYALAAAAAFLWRYFRTS